MAARSQASSISASLVTTALRVPEKFVCKRRRVQGRELRNRANYRVNSHAGKNTVQRLAWTAARGREHGDELRTRANYRVDDCAGKNTVQRLAWTAAPGREHGDDLRMRANGRVDSHAETHSLKRIVRTANLNGERAVPSTFSHQELRCKPGGSGTCRDSIARKDTSIFRDLSGTTVKCRSRKSLLRRSARRKRGAKASLRLRDPGVISALYAPLRLGLCAWVYHGVWRRPFDSPRDLPHGEDDGPAPFISTQRHRLRP